MEHKLDLERAQEAALAKAWDIDVALLRGVEKVIPLSAAVKLILEQRAEEAEHCRIQLRNDVLTADELKARVSDLKRQVPEAELACSYCGGTGIGGDGFLDDKREACDQCNGTGKRIVASSTLEPPTNNWPAESHSYNPPRHNCGSNPACSECERLRAALRESRIWIKAKLGLADGQTNPGWEESPLRLMIDTALASKPEDSKP